MYTYQTLAYLLKLCYFQVIGKKFSDIIVCLKVIPDESEEDNDDRKNMGHEKLEADIESIGNRFSSDDTNPKMKIGYNRQQ